MKPLEPEPGVQSRRHSGAQTAPTDCEAPGMLTPSPRPRRSEQATSARRGGGRHKAGARGPVDRGTRYRAVGRIRWRGSRAGRRAHLLYPPTRAPCDSMHLDVCLFQLGRDRRSVSHRLPDRTNRYRHARHPRRHFIDQPPLTLTKVRPTLAETVRARLRRHPTGRPDLRFPWPLRTGYVGHAQRGPCHGKRPLPIRSAHCDTFARYLLGPLRYAGLSDRCEYRRVRWP
jgi:hypothetical protein